MAKENEKQENAIVAARMQLNGAGLVLRNAADLKLASELFKNAGLAPKWCDTPAKAAFVIEAGQEIGLKPVQALNSFQLIEGQLGIKAQAVAGLIRGSGKAEYLKDSTEGKPGTEGYKVVVRSKRKDDPNEKVTEFSMAEAAQAGLANKHNWKHYPQDMLWCRAMARHGRRYYSDVLCGFYTTEELKDITPPEAAPTPEAPGREERKKVDATVTDTNQTIEGLMEKCLTKFVEIVGIKTGIELHPADILRYFAVFASYQLGGSPNDYQKPEAYTLDSLAGLLKTLETAGIAKPVLEQVGFKSDEGISAAEAEATAEEKFGTDVKMYHCPDCGRELEEAEVTTSPNGKTQCNKCFNWNVHEKEPEGVADGHS